MSEFGITVLIVVIFTALGLLVAVISAWQEADNILYAGFVERYFNRSGHRCASMFMCLMSIC